MAFLWGLSSGQLFSVASCLLLVAQVLKKPSSSSLGIGVQQGKQRVQDLDTALLSPFLPVLCCLPKAPLLLVMGLVPPQHSSLPQPGALLSPPVPICFSWLLLPKSEEEISLSRGEGEGQQSSGQQCIPVHGTTQVLRNYWDGPGFDPQLNMNPFQMLVGKVQEAHGGLDGMIYTHVCLW